MGFIELNRRLGELQNTVFINLMIETLDELETEIANLNREQLLEGVDGLGNLMPPYSFLTTQRSPHKNGRIKLYDEGDFHASIFASSNGTFLELSAKDWKYEMLEERYGNILGIAPQSQRTLGDMIAEKMKVKVGNYLKQT